MLTFTTASNSIVSKLLQSANIKTSCILILKKDKIITIVFFLCSLISQVRESQLSGISDKGRFLDLEFVSLFT